MNKSTRRDKVDHQQQSAFGEFQEWYNTDFQKHKMGNIEYMLKNRTVTDKTELVAQMTQYGKYVKPQNPKYKEQKTILGMQDLREKSDIIKCEF